MARTIRDSDGRDWRIAIDVPTLDRIREQTGADLVEVVEGKHIDRLYADPKFLVGVLYAVCEPDVLARSMTPEQFAALFIGDVIDDAVAALGGALVDFFPKFRRALLQRVMESARTAIDATATALLERLTPAMVHEAVRQGIAQALEKRGPLFGPAPESSGSPPES